MSNPTELPDLADAVRKLVKAKGRFHTEQNYKELADALTRYDSRRAQPEGEAPRAVATWQQRLQKAHPTSEAAYWPDDLKAKYMAAEIEELRAATLSPLCGAQHAESGKAAIPTWQERAQELGFSGRRQGYPDTDEQEQLKAAEIADLRAALAAQQAAAPGAPEAPKPPFPISDDEMAALRRFWECATDGEGYDVEKSMMQRLAEMGLVQRKSGAYYMATEFGLYVLGEYTMERAAQLDGDQEGSESNG